MNREEQRGRTWRNAIPDPTSQSSPPFGPFSNGFPLWGDGILINKWFNDEADQINNNVDLRLAREFSGMSIFDDHHQGNNSYNNNNNINIAAATGRTRGHGVPLPYTYNNHQNTPPLGSFDHHAHASLGNIVVPHHHYDQEIVTNVVGSNSPPKRCVSYSPGLAPKGHAFGPYHHPQHPQVESSSSLGNSARYGYAYGRGVPLPQKPSFASSYPYDGFVCSSPRGSTFVMENDPFLFPPPPTMQFQPNNKLNAPLSPRDREVQLQLPQSLSPRTTIGDPVAFKCDNSFIIQEKDMKQQSQRGCNNSVMLGGGGGRKYVSQEEIVQVPHLVSRISDDVVPNNAAAPHSMMLSFGSLGELQGYMCHMAKDQNGCRFLQRMVDEGTSEDTEIVFKGVVDNVVELMMDPFGNYLVQKLLDVCRDDQRLQIVLMLTKEPGQLIRTSLNAHGTRVVQKLIGTLNSRKQISLVRSALQPGFLDLTKDLNGNHVIQRCLQCLSGQDNEFIFDAAVKFCVDIATHQHGCCVLQRCIDHSTGKNQDKLVKEICKHGLLLAQDPYGNYVVQYAIEMENPSTSAKLTAQFKGKYVSLSMQKFSSHVVEKCLIHIAECRSRIIQELLSVPHFEQLLQDPFANYVVQRALIVTKGSLHASMVEAVRPHKMLRTSPYCKRIFSRNILKK